MTTKIDIVGNFTSESTIFYPGDIITPYFPEPEPETQRAVPEDLLQKVSRLEQIIKQQSQRIDELQHQVDELVSYIRQNTAGQQGPSKPDYFQEI